MHHSKTDRRHIQAQAAAAGLPATGSTADIAQLLRVAVAHPKSWSEQEFLAILPHLCIHQDVAAGHADRVGSVMAQGLRRGQVDSVQQFFSGGWTWARGHLLGVDSYLFIAGSLRYLGKGNPFLAAGNMPLCHILPQKGNAAEGLYRAIVQTARVPRDFEQPTAHHSEDAGESSAADAAPPGQRR